MRFFLAQQIGLSLTFFRRYVNCSATKSRFAGQASQHDLKEQEPDRAHNVGGVPPRPDQSQGHPSHYMGHVVTSGNGGGYGPYEPCGPIGPYGPHGPSGLYYVSNH